MLELWLGFHFMIQWRNMLDHDRYLYIRGKNWGVGFWFCFVFKKASDLSIRSLYLELYEYTEGPVML